MELDSKTFDLISALEGREYPKEVVDVYLAEDVAYEIQRADEALNILSLKGDSEAYRELEAKRDALKEKVRASKITFTLSGTSRDDKVLVRSEWLKHCLNEDNTPKIPAAYHQEELNILTLAAQTLSIQGPDGSLVPLNEDVIRSFRGKAPDAAITRVDAALRKVNTVSEGFDYEAQSVDF